MARKVYVLFFILLMPFARGRSLKDSLLLSLSKQKEDSLKVKTLIHLSRALSLNETQRSLEYAQQALKLSETIKWNRGIALSYFYIGASYDNLGNFRAALEIRLKEVEKWKELNNKKNTCAVMGNLGVSYGNIGNNLKAIEYYISSLKIAEEIDFTEQAINNLCNIGSIYKEQKNYDKALSYYFESLKLAEQEKLENSIAINQGNIGNVYLAMGKYTLSLKSYLAALRIDEKLGNKINQSAWVANIASLYQVQSDSASKAGNTELANFKSSQALEYYVKSLQLSKEIGNQYLEAHTLGNIGELYASMKQFKMAEEYMKESLDLATKIQSDDVVRAAHNKLYALYSEIKQPAKALEHYEKYIAIRDSIYNEDHKKTISELEIKYQTEKKEAENILLTEKNQVQALEIRNERYMLVGLSILLLLGAAIAFLIVRQNKLKSQQLATQFEQKLLRTQMNPHFIFNSLASIEIFIYDHQPKEAGVYLSSFARLMRLILENSTLEYITLEKEIEILNYYLSLQKVRLDDNLSYSIEVDENIYPSEIRLPPMLTQPFIENAIEHGFRGSKQVGEVKVSFRLKENNLQVEIVDNGIGIEKAHQQNLHKTHKSMATQITSERLAFLNRSKRKKLSFTIIDLATEGQGLTGTRVTFLIPL